MAPRSLAEVETSLTESISSANPGIKTLTGPIRRAVIKPVSTEVSSAENAADHLSQLSSLNFSAATTDQELENLAAALGIERKPGKGSTGFVVFATAVRPSALTTLTVTAATLVGTAQGGLVYQTTEERSLPGSNADAFFVASRRRFELRVPIEALAVGADHDVAPGRISVILVNLDDFTVVENLEDITGGVSAETNAELASRIRERLLGIDRGVNGGLIEEALRFDDTVKAATPIYSTDTELFRRRTTRPAIDLCISGSYDRIVTDVFTALGGETEFTMGSQPVVEVTDVTVNGAGVTFSLAKDSSLETGGSTLGRDKVVLSSPLGAGDQLEVTYTANGLLLDMQQEFGSDGASSRFGTIITLRGYRQVVMEVNITASGLGSFSEVDLAEAITAGVFDYVDSGEHKDALSPDELAKTLLQTVAGISRLRINTFRRTDGGPSFGVVTLAKNEISTSTDSLVLVTVRR
jgi:hypothetical protein